MFDTIVVAVDGSDPSNRAIQAACTLAGLNNGAIHLVHVPFVDLAAYAVGAGAFAVAPTPASVQDAGAEVMEQAVALAQTAGCTVADTLIINGDTGDEIVRYAMTQGADLIVAGRRGRGSLGALFLGSVSQQIAHEANCAVLTVK